MNEETIITSYFRCQACSKPCEALHLTSGSQSLCCNASIERVLSQPVLPSTLPASHPASVKVCSACREICGVTSVPRKSLGGRAETRLTVSLCCQAPTYALSEAK